MSNQKPPEKDILKMTIEEKVLSLRADPDAWTHISQFVAGSRLNAAGKIEIVVNPELSEAKLFETQARLDFEIVNIIKYKQMLEMKKNKSRIVTPGRPGFRNFLSKKRH